MQHAMTWRQLAAAIGFLFVGTSTPVAATGPLPGGEAIDDLRRTHEWVLEIDGEPRPEATIYYSDYEVAWLVEAPAAGSLLISPRGESVQRVAARGLHKSGGSTAALGSGATLGLATRYTTTREGVRFELEGRAYELRPAQPMLGRQTAAAVATRHPGFDEAATVYQAKARVGAPLREVGADDLRVAVYFGSWSPICRRIVPKIIGIERAWQTLRFEYYGLPRPLVGDPHAVEQGISGVPTLVIFRGDEEIHRLTGRQLDDPAAALERALGELAN